MRIAYDHQIFAAQRYGGISRYFVEVADRIACMPGNDVSIVSPLYVNSYLRSNAGNIRILGRYAPSIPYTTRVRQEINYRLAHRSLRNLQPALVHETYYTSKSAAPRGAKVVLTVFDMIHELFPKCFHSYDPTRENKVQAVKRADHVICISECTRTDLVNLIGINPARTTVIHLGFSLQVSPSDDRRVSHLPFLLYVGNRGAYKNFSTLLHAYATRGTLNRENKIIAFGGGALRENERQLMRELGIPPDQVRQLSGDDYILADLYRRASLLVYPSMYEGFGIPPLEAMSYGCPVVCSNSGSLPEVVGDAAETFDPTSIDALGTAVERVLNDSMLRKKLIARGYERAKLFSWQRCADQTSDIYRRLLA
jgi:glycosyltransferase involved in cell wall biosynthesis